MATTQQRLVDLPLTFVSFLSVSSSDADADVLADYVLALLRHDGDIETIRKLFEEEIPDFLREGMIANPVQVCIPSAIPARRDLISNGGLCTPMLWDYMLTSDRCGRIYRRCLTGSQVSIICAGGSSCSASCPYCSLWHAATTIPSTYCTGTYRVPIHRNSVIDVSIPSLGSLCRTFGTAPLPASRLPQTWLQRSQRRRCGYYSQQSTFIRPVV